MTIQQLKDLLSTYGVNDEERGAPVLVNVNGIPTPLTDGMVEYGIAVEASYSDLVMGTYVLLETAT